MSSFRDVKYKSELIDGMTWGRTRNGHLCPVELKINLELSPLFVHIPLLITNIFFEFQVYIMFSNGRDILQNVIFAP